MASAIRPTGIPEWATKTPTGITEPTATKKETGWQNSEQPSAAYMNWLQEKQSAWIRYLSYERAVEDNFVRPRTLVGIAIPSGGVATGFAPLWSVTGVAAISFAAGIGGSSGPVTPALMGFIDFLQTYSGLSAIRTSLGDIASDFLMEAKVALAQRGASGCKQTIGMLPLGASSVGVWWSATGPSSHWFINFGGSGANGSTAIDTGIDPYSPNANLHTLTVERVGATMLAQINGASCFAYGMSGSLGYCDFGVHVINASGTNELAVDHLLFGIRR